MRTAHAQQCQPPWADQLLLVGEPQHGLKGQNISSPTLGLLSQGDHTALLTHETNTCKLFKNISIKLPGWLRAAPIRSARAPSSPQPPFHYGRFLEAKISSVPFSQE